MAKELVIHLSKTGDYENFEEGVNDDDSFSVLVPSTNGFRWVESLVSLLVGTAGDEWRIASNKLDTPLTPTSYSVKQQTTYGSNKIQPVKVGGVILFVDFVGRKVRELTYSGYPQDKYTAPDLTALAEHITEGTIAGIAHQRNPDSILWCTLNDGTLISMTYERKENVIAWSKHPIDGEVNSICAVPSTSEDYIWLSVERTINSVDVTHIERMASRTFTATEDCFFVDAGITVTNDPASTTIAGLTHLIGEAVTVLGDGVVYTPTAVVDSSGEVGISTAVEKAQVGLAYTYKLEPMKPVVNTQMGTSAASIVSAHEMGVSLLNSAGVKSGASDSTLVDIDLDQVELVNLSDISGLFTGSVVVSVDGGFSLERPLIISGSDPLPCTVRALIPKMDITGR